MRDWSRGQALGYYSIHPSHFNTRLPLHINDDDICQTTMKVNDHGHIAERPRSEFTMLSYTIHAIEIAIFARESIDLRGPLRQVQREEEISDRAKVRNHINKQYESFVAGLPSYFRLGSTMGLTSTGPMAAIPVHRWMLHQQLWSLFLRLHRASLSFQEGRTFCQLLAQNLISNQAQIQARCAVCCSLSKSKNQLFNAAIVLLVSLLYSSEQNDADLSSAHLSRLMTRDKIREAIELLQTRNDVNGSPPSQEPRLEGVRDSARRSAIVLENLLKLEEQSSKKEENTEAKRSLKNKIMDILEGLQGNSRDAGTSKQRASLDSFSPHDMTMPVPTASDGFQDLDVLPTLLNDPSCDLWQFLNLSPPRSTDENISFLTSSDLLNLEGSMLVRPSPDVARSLNGFGTPEFADVYSNTDGTSVIYTPLSSTESGYTKLNGGGEVTTIPSATDGYLAAKFNLT